MSEQSIFAHSCNVMADARRDAASLSDVPVLLSQKLPGAVSR
jgi:hypothetical protein